MRVERARAAALHAAEPLKRTKFIPATRITGSQEGPRRLPSRACPAERPRPNGLLQNVLPWCIAGPAEVGGGTARLSPRYSAKPGTERLDISLPRFLLAFTPGFFLAEVNTTESSVHERASTRQRTPTASHILRMKTFTTILARGTPPTCLPEPCTKRSLLMSLCPHLAVHSSCFCSPCLGLDRRFLPSIRVYPAT